MLHLVGYILEHFSNSLNVVLDLNSELEHVFTGFYCTPCYIQTSYSLVPRRTVARWELINSLDIYEFPLSFEGRYLSPPTKHPWLRNYTALMRSSFQYGYPPEGIFTVGGTRRRCPWPDTTTYTVQRYKRYQNTLASNASKCHGVPHYKSASQLHKHYRRKGRRGQRAQLTQLTARQCRPRTSSTIRIYRIYTKEWCCFKS